MSYMRVIPRDLFNESKLLKCMGQLALKVHDEMTPSHIKGNWDTPISIKIIHEDESFNIVQSNDDGSLSISNMAVVIKGSLISFKTMYNSKDSYPLYAEYEYFSYLVFDEKGEWHEEFLQLYRKLRQ